MFNIKIIYIQSYGTDNFLPKSLMDMVGRDIIITDEKIIKAFESANALDVVSLPYKEDNQLYKLKEFKKDVAVTYFHYNGLNSILIEFELLYNEIWSIIGQMNEDLTKTETTHNLLNLKTKLVEDTVALDTFVLQGKQAVQSRRLFYF